jgi:hypothetical protein
MTARPPASRSPSPLGVFLLAALLLGVAAALLTGTPPIPPNTPSSAGWVLNYGGLVIFSAIVIGLVVAWVVYRLIQRIRDPSGSTLLGPPTVVFVVMFLLAIVFLVLARFLHSSSSMGPPTGGNRSTGGALPPPGNGTSLPGSISSPGGFPGWETYAAVLIVGVVLALVVAPFVASRLLLRSAPPEASVDEAAARTRAEVADTLRRLEADPSADPRALIVALYARLLSRVEPRLTDLDAKTAREVERLAVAELGLPEPAARELTVLFEEARYSVHPLGAEESARARDALARILASLAAEPA